MDKQNVLDILYNNFGGQNMNMGENISFNKVAKDLQYNPTDIALELSKSNSANAINSSLGIGSLDNNSPIAQSSASLKGFPITQAFGNKNPGVEVFSHGINTGVDIGVPKNTPVSLPPGKWQVISAFDKAKTGYVGDNENQGYGNSVLVRNVDTGEQLRFSHLSQVYLPSDSLRGGQTIGLSGATGNVTGPHLDIEYKTAQGQFSDFTKTQYAQALGLGGNQ